MELPLVGKGNSGVSLAMQWFWLDLSLWQLLHQLGPLSFTVRAHALSSDIAL